jgi:hypothetical protein
VSNPVPPPPAQNQPGSPSTEGAAPEDPTVPLVSGEGPAAPGSQTTDEADAEPTQLLSDGSSDGSEPTEPLSDGSEPTRLMSGGSEPTQFMASGSGTAGFRSAESERTELLPGQPVPVAQPATVGSEPAGQFGEQPVRPRKSARNLILSVVGIVVVVIIGAAIMLAAGGGRDKDEAKDAKVGDCVAALGKVSQKEGQNTQTAAKVVKCGAQDASYKVIGRVNGQSDTNSKSCDQYFTDAKADYFIYASSSGDGYLLCLQSTKA